MATKSQINKQKRLTVIQTLKHNLQRAESEIIHQQRIIGVEKLLRIERNR